MGLSTMAQDSLASVSRCQGLFSVSNTVKVRFAPGNLQYQPSTHLYRFAATQTETLGWEAGFASERYKGWVDLFGWGTGSNAANRSEKASDYTFVDWGIYCALPTEGGKMWRTLTMDEWTYLLSKRPKARRLYAVAYVTGIYGLILLPDDWQCPKGVYLKPGPKEDKPNYFGQENWQKLEAAGAVFLPCEVKRMGDVPQGGASSCHYWTSSPNAKKSAEALYILVDPFVPQARSVAKPMGLSVRLAQEL